MRQTASLKKDQVLADLADARRDLLDVAAPLPQPAHHTVFLGTWTAIDLLAHLVGWDSANIEGIEAVLAGRLPAFYAHYDPDWRTFNASLVDAYRQDSLAESITAAEDSHRRLLATARAVPAVDFGRDHGVRSPRGRRVTIAMLLGAEAGDERVHAQQIRDFARSLAPAETPWPIARAPG